MNIEGFSSQELKVRPKYFGHPKLLVNDKKVKVFKRIFFKRIKFYRIKDDYGNDVEIKFKRRVFDAYPTVEIYGNKIELGESIKKIDYLLIGWPVILSVFGGFLGAVICTLSIFTNAVLLRKIRKKISMHFFSFTLLHKNYFSE